MGRITRAIFPAGIFAARACLRIGSQPPSTTGARMMASTCCAMNAPSALIWLSCFCCASENLRFMPRLVASERIDFVSTVRQPLSAPIWEKPTVMGFLPEDSADSQRRGARDMAPANTIPATRICRVMIFSFLMLFYQQIEPGATHANTGG